MELEQVQDSSLCAKGGNEREKKWIRSSGESSKWRKLSEKDSVPPWNSFPFLHISKSIKQALWMCSV